MARIIGNLHAPPFPAQAIRDRRKPVSHCPADNFRFGAADSYTASATAAPIAAVFTFFVPVDQMSPVR